jgi:hypothetical protein
MKNQQHRRPSFALEPLEIRDFLSASPTVTADTTFATTTKCYVSATSAVIGQTVDVTAKVSSTGGTPTGVIELLDDNKDTGLTANLNSAGHYVFTLDASQALYAGSFKFSIRYLTTGNFVGSKSKQVGLVVTTPKLSVASNGLEVASVTAGSGVGAKPGQTLTVQYTGFDAANGEEFDDSAAHSPGTFSFILDDSPEQVIAGFDQMCKGMQVGETRVAIIPSALGYADGETRVFIVHLVSIT